MGRTRLALGALLGLGVIISAVMYFAGGRAAQTELSTARAVPADTALYLGLNADLDSDAWSRAFRLVGRLGLEDPLGELRELVADAGLDWDDDVRPFLGRDISVWVRSLTASVPEVGVVFRCEDLDRCRRALRDELRASREAEVDGLRYWTAEDGGAAVAELGDVLVLASSESALLAMRDAYEGREPSLADAGEFSTLRDELTPEFLVFAFVRPDVILAELGADALGLEGDELDPAQLQPLAVTINAGERGYVLQGATLGDSRDAASFLDERDWRLIDRVPADAVFVLSVQGVADIWRSVRGAVEEAAAGLREEVDELGGNELEPFEDALSDDLEVGPIGDLLELFSGETVLSVWRDGDEVAVLLLADVADAEAAEDALSRLFASEAKEEREIAGVRVRFVEGGEVGYAVHEGLLWVGTPSGLEAGLSGADPTLAESRRFQSAVGLLPTGLGPFLYLDVPGIVEWAEEPAALPEVGSERLPAALVVTVVEERGVLRAAGALLVEE